METRRLNLRVIKQFNAVNFVFIFSFEILKMESGCCLVRVKVSVSLIGVFQLSSCQPPLLGNPWLRLIQREGLKFLQFLHVNSGSKVNLGWFCQSNDHVVSFFFSSMLYCFRNSHHSVKLSRFLFAIFLAHVFRFWMVKGWPGSGLKNTTGYCRLTTRVGVKCLFLALCSYSTQGKNL